MWVIFSILWYLLNVLDLSFWIWFPIIRNCITLCLSAVFWLGFSCLYGWIWRTSCFLHTWRWLFRVFETSQARDISLQFCICILYNNISASCVSFLNSFQALSSQLYVSGVMIFALCSNFTFWYNWDE